MLTGASLAVLVGAGQLQANTLLGWPWLVTGLLSVSLAISGWRHQAGQRRWRLLGSTAGSVAFFLLLSSQVSALSGLFLLLAWLAFLLFIWPSERLRRSDAIRKRVTPFLDVLSAAAIALGLGLYAFQHAGEFGPVPILATVAALVFALWQACPKRPWSGRVLWTYLPLFVLVSLPLFSLLSQDADFRQDLLGAALLTPAGILVVFLRRAFLLREAIGKSDADWLRLALDNPSRVMVVSFLAICTLGTVLLGLPVASSTGEGLAWLDAAFTSVSATCVTGLVVLDTPQAFGAFGQLVILLLIQIGGLGIMVFSAAALVLLGKRLSMSHERAATDLVGASARSGLVSALRRVLLVTFITEGSAALLLTLAFIQRGDALGTAIWRGVFTSISAFCNAGFALQSESLIPYADSPFILSVLAVTIIIGGLGPAVVWQLGQRRSATHRSLHARIVIWTTLTLLLLPALLFALVEWNGGLSGLSTVDKLFNAAFQSVTLRTAGFNSIDLTAMGAASWTIMVLLMFIGGSPGSTAGGIKTTTFAVVILSIVSVVRGRDRVDVFGRTLPNNTVLRAAAVLMLSALVAGCALLALQLTQPIPLDLAFFEVISALATVGLSLGATSALDEVGKVIIIASMFAGRVGPLTLFVFLSARSARQHIVKFPEESLPIG